MNNEKILKKKIQQYLLMPLALTVLLVGMVIVLYVHDKKSGAIAAAAVFIFVVCEIIFFIVMKAAIMPIVFRFALEQGQIQKELLKELDIPYALLDTDGKILWQCKVYRRDWRWIQEADSEKHFGILPGGGCGGVIVRGNADGSGI